MKMRFYVLLSIAACCFLALSSVWLGALNQDEGWYIYASRMVAHGFMPYRDFAFTQGPVMPIVYSAFDWVWSLWGVVGARFLTLVFGFCGIVLAAQMASRLAPKRMASLSGVITLLLLGCTLYHVYFLTIPKTYALASLFMILGFYFLSIIVRPPALVLKLKPEMFAFFAAVAFSFSAGTRISTILVMAVVWLWFLFAREWRNLIAFSAGAIIALFLIYGSFMLDPLSREGLIAAQRYHAQRGGFDLVWVVGSVSRLVRWYTPLFIVLGLAFACGGFITKDRPFGKVLFLSPLAVFLAQLAAPFPYEDYQVTLMALFAIYASVKFSVAVDRGEIREKVAILAVLGLSFATSFGSPLIEKWMTNGQDRFWTIKKEKPEVLQLREISKEIEALDPGGKTLLTQDLYIAIETGRMVPRGLEMGPFSILSDEQWKNILLSSQCNIAALSGYTFAIEPPECNERSVEKQMEYWGLLKENYKLVSKEENFGQNATTLLILKKK